MSRATEVAALQASLAVAHAAVHGYGLLGARLPEGERDAAREAADASRGRRDALVRLVRDRGADPLVAPPDYAVEPPADRAAALALAVRLEEAAAVAARDLVAATLDPSLRSAAVSALTDAAVRATRWRLAAGTGSTVPLPGDPEGFGATGSGAGAHVSPSPSG